MYPWVGCKWILSGAVLQERASVFLLVSRSVGKA